MKIPEGQQFHGFGLRLIGGDDLPDDLVAQLPADHPYRQAPAAPRRSAPAAPSSDKGS
jgi:hypothetical protein